MSSDTPETDAGAVPADVFLKSGGDKRLGWGHPWVYANEVRMDEAAKAIPPGAAAVLHRVDGKRLALGTFNPHALICFRSFTEDYKGVIDAAFLEQRLRRAKALRERLLDGEHYRLIHGEADGLPGFVVDRMGDVCVVQASTAGADRLEAEMLQALDRVVAPRAVVLKNDGAGRGYEGLEAEVRVAKGKIEGPVEVREGDLTFLCDPLEGQKTGWFFDQRPNREYVAGLSADQRVLDAYGYTGSFAIRAAAAGAREVLCVDRSRAALELGQLAARMNGLAKACTFREAEVFQTLEALGAEHDSFGIVHCDPPAFAKSKKEVGPARRGYRKLARLASRVVGPGGLLALSSCSHNVTAEAFLEECGRGIHQSGRAGRLLRQGGAGPDHPVHPMLPESAYLKALLFQLD